MKKRNFLFVCAVLVVITFFLSRFSQEVTISYKKNKAFKAIGAATMKVLENSSSDCTFAIKDLSHKRIELVIGKSKQFPAASLIKIPILAVAIEAINEGKVSLRDKVIIERKDITGGSGKIKAFSLPHTLTLEKLLELMISVSDNTATNKIINILSFEYIRNSFVKMELNETVLVRKVMDFSLRRKGIENYTSASDIMSVLEKIYDNKLGTPELSSLALSFLKKQKVRDRLPRYLPESIVVANKTGLERGVIHDAGIVFSPKGDYIICILLKNVTSFKTAKKLIAHLSLLTYNLYQ